MHQPESIAQQILDSNMYKGIEKTRYCNDKAITDHYAIIPTGQGFGKFIITYQSQLHRRHMR